MFLYDILVIQERNLMKRLIITISIILLSFVLVACDKGEGVTHGNQDNWLGTIEIDSSLSSNIIVTWPDNGNIYLISNIVAHEVNFSSFRAGGLVSSNTNPIQALEGTNYVNHTRTFMTKTGFFTISMVRVGSVMIDQLTFTWELRNQ